MHAINVQSEIGKLKGVILHTPGREVEKMTPENAAGALYSDILNLAVASEEYAQFKGVLQNFCTTYEVKELLTDILKNEKVRQTLIPEICRNEAVPELTDYLLSLEEKEIARQLIEGVEIERNNLTKYLSEERYSLKPLHNFLFTRDASMSIYDKVLIGKMASSVRDRESVIMEAIFKYHQNFKVETINPLNNSTLIKTNTISIEGGDVLIARDDVLIIGTGIRTSTQGIDFIIESFKQAKKPIQHIIVQELPETPESFIHLDMVFTFIDKDTCMVHEPLILEHSRYRTLHITIENGKVVSIKDEAGLMQVLTALNFDLKPIMCGGSDMWNQEREQWHSGANFLALSPGVVIGYERNVHTIEALNKADFAVIKASEILKKSVKMPTQKTVITIAGAELARGGGGARCMSMPVFRENIQW